MSNVLLIVFVIVSMLISVLWGFLRGLSKARIRGISVILCAVGAVVLAIASRQWIVSDWFASELVLPFALEMENAQIVREALGMSKTLNEALLHCITSLIAPILCVVYFLILSFLLSLFSIFRKNNTPPANRISSMKYFSLKPIPMPTNSNRLMLTSNNPANKVTLIPIIHNKMDKSSFPFFIVFRLSP